MIFENSKQEPSAYLLHSLSEQETVQVNISLAQVQKYRQSAYIVGI